MFSIILNCLDFYLPMNDTHILHKYLIVNFNKLIEYVINYFLILSFLADFGFAIVAFEFCSNCFHPQ